VPHHGKKASAGRHYVAVQEAVTLWGHNTGTRGLALNETTVSNDSSDQGMGTRQRLARGNAGEGRLDCVEKRHRGESPISAEVPTKELSSQTSRLSEELVVETHLVFAVISQVRGEESIS